MSLTTFIFAWLISVVCMTLFSAIWSEVSGNQFREPTLLSKLINAYPVKNAFQKSSYALGWMLHFILGIIFLGFYEILWELTNLSRTFFWSLVFGSILGILGILGWMLLFKIVNFSSQFNYLQYYIHLYFAHLIFSLSAFFVYITFQ